MELWMRSSILPHDILLSFLWFRVSSNLTLESTKVIWYCCTIIFLCELGWILYFYLVRISSITNLPNTFSHFFFATNLPGSYHFWCKYERKLGIEILTIKNVQSQPRQVGSGSLPSSLQLRYAFLERYLSLGLGICQKHQCRLWLPVLFLSFRVLSNSVLPMPLSLLHGVDQDTQGTSRLTPMES